MERIEKIAKKMVAGAKPEVNVIDSNGKILLACSFEIPVRMALSLNELRDFVKSYIMFVDTCLQIRSFPTSIAKFSSSVKPTANGVLTLFVDYRADYKDEAKKQEIIYYLEALDSKMITVTNWKV